MSRGVLICVCLGLLVLTSMIAADWWVALPPGREPQYVGRRTCAECHSEQHAAWSGSHHDLAMDRATPGSVLGEFNDVEFTYRGVTSKFFRRDDGYYVHTEDADGKMRDFRIAYTFGVEPLQQYMIEFPDGRVQVLRIAWDTVHKKWFYVPPPDVTDERIQPDDPLHWTGVAQNWNHSCADCHSTNVHKNYDLATGTYHTTFSEIDVSCEACHGPGSLHVELAESRSLFWDRRYGYGLARLKEPQNRTEIEACAKCHSRRNQIHAPYRPGQDLLESYEPALLESELYHADGQILDEVYVYGSFLQSRMYRENVRCTDCHDPHTSRLKRQGNRLCTECHTPGKYDTPAHHHHEVGSDGARCVECHMPDRTYMVVDPRRDHSLRVPRPDLSVALGTPNACNQCHNKPHETPQWAADKIVAWYGERRPDDPHYAPALAAGRQMDPAAADDLTRLVKRRATPDIVRATALSLLASYPGHPAARATEATLTHANPLVRAAAVRALPESHPGQVLRALAPALTDPVRAVRITAATRLAAVPPRLLTRPQREALQRAVAEYEASQHLNADRAAAHLNLGNLYQDLGRHEAAETAFRTAIRLEPYLAGPRSNLALLLERTEGDGEEVHRLRSEELELLARDVRHFPDNPWLRERYGLLLYLTGHPEEAQSALEAAARLAPQARRIRLELTLLYEKYEQWESALQSARQLLRLSPDDPAARAILHRLQQRADRSAG